MAERRDPNRRMSDGPSLETYVETRLNLLTKQLEDALAERDRRYSQRWDASQKEMMAALAAADRAVTKAEMSAEKRFESVNEFRNTLADQQRNLIPRAEVDVRFAGLHEKINALEKHIDTFAAERQGIKGGWGYAVGVVGIVLTILSIIAVLIRFARP